MRFDFLKFQKDRCGNLYVETIVKLLLVATILILTIHVFAMVLQYQHVVYSAKAIAKVVEQNGEYGSEAKDMLIQLNDNFEANMKMEISDVTYFDSSGKIQFRDSFVISVSDVYTLPIITPYGKKGVNIEVPMKSDVVGISEVYWKE